MQYYPDRLAKATPYYQDLSQRVPSGTLFHYTSHVGLIRLAESKSVSASNIHFFNDAEEFAYAVRIVNQILYQRKAASQNPLELKFFEYLPDAVERESHVNIHVFCLSEEMDQLSLWRGYCPGGNGLAIGFQWETIRNRVESQGFRIVQCIYERESQVRVIDELLNFVLLLLQEKDMTDGPMKRAETVEQVANHFVNRFWERAPMIKHPSFKEEKEWRLVSGLISSKHEQVRIRPGISTLVPYFQLDISQDDGLHLGDIVIGPTPHPKLAMDGVGALLSCYGIHWKSILNSMIPYRNW